MLELILVHGLRWQTLAKYMENRPPSAIRNRFFRLTVSGSRHRRVRTNRPRSLCTRCGQEKIGHVCHDASVDGVVDHVVAEAAFYSDLHEAADATADADVATEEEEKEEEEADVTAVRQVVEEMQGSYDAVCVMMVA